MASQAPPAYVYLKIDPAKKSLKCKYSNGVLRMEKLEHCSSLQSVTWCHYRSVWTYLEKIISLACDRLGPA